ncbi:MAG: biopolymer transport protein ExbD [Verrucomicrobiales bacterium]|jgi:biopolymer transport protein ExbD
MKRFRHRARSRPEQTEINLSPLIDMVFILLIFFIVTTVFVKESGVKVEKPQALTSAALDQQSILLGIDATGQVFYGGRQVGVEGVRAIVRRLLDQEDQPIIIQADKNVPTGTTLRVLDEAKLAGAEKISIATVKE